MAKLIRQIVFTPAGQRLRVTFDVVDDTGAVIGSGNVDVTVDALPVELAQWNGLSVALTARVQAKL